MRTLLVWMIPLCFGAVVWTVCTLLMDWWEDRR